MSALGREPDAWAHAKAFIHAGAWGYTDAPSLKRGPTAFASVTAAPDYRPELDLVVFDEQGRGAAMAAFWYDERNRWGILEPLATHQTHQKRGLGKALLAEGLTRLEHLGACGLWVGSDQPFYLALGFRVRNRVPVWSKTY